LLISQDLTGFWISFSNEKGVSRVHSPMDSYSGRSTMDHNHGRAAPTTGARRDGAKMERGWGEPHHGQEVAAEARGFAGDERGTVAVVEA
jgi:hypothetical protein